ncbi:hypothetical protein HY486_01355 [Candidatus Woesearchaeota archaeon]|nr:hypothetical protein [Candidatus Woesearchaeota archaeon]
MKERFVNAGSGVCAGMSILGSWQICHNVCLAIITFLSLVGITVAGMPLLFLTKVAVPLWIAAFVLLVLGIILSFGFHMHLSKKVLLVNTGLIIAGIPFLQEFYLFFWIVGGLLVISGIVWAVVSRKNS